MDNVPEERSTWLTSRQQASDDRSPLVRASSSRYMRMLDQMIVGQNRTLAVVQAGERYLLLGVGPDRIEMLLELSEEDLIPIGGEGGEQTVDFGRLLSRIGRKKDEE